MNSYPCSVEEYQEHCDSNDGICIHCGQWGCGGVEPDAEGYKCESCGKNGVMGAENALLMGVLDIDEE
jgi:hypothetical protein